MSADNDRAALAYARDYQMRRQGLTGAAIALAVSAIVALVMGDPVWLFLAAVLIWQALKSRPMLPPAVTARVAHLEKYGQK